MQVKLLDFNPVLGTTNPLLFTWAELGFTPNALLAAIKQDNINGASPPCLEASDLQQSRTPTGNSDGDGDHEPGTANTQEESLSEASSSITSRESHEQINEPVQAERTPDQIEIRIVTEVNKIQPNMPTYGVPYDLIDNSETSAYSDLIEKLKERQTQDVYVD